MNKKQRILTYSLMLGHYVLMSLLNFFAYSFWGFGGLAGLGPVMSISAAFFAFLIFFTFKNRVKSVVLEVVGIEAILWGVQEMLITKGIYNPPAAGTGGFEQELGFALTPLIYLVVELIIVALAGIIIGIVYMINRNKER